MIDSKTNFLSVCTSFRRPKMLLNMLKSFYKTRSEGAEVFVYLHEDDPHIEEYKMYIGAFSHEIGKHRNLRDVVQYAVFDKYPELPNYQIICDDHLYHTSNWSNILVKALNEMAGGWGFACGRDLINGDDWMRHQHPSAEIWSWKFCKTMGYVYPPSFSHQGIDFFTKDMALAVNGLVFVPQVIIEHLWYGGCGKPPDINILEGYSKDAFAKADKAFELWKLNEKPELVRKVLEAKEREKIASM